MCVYIYIYMYMFVYVQSLPLSTKVPLNTHTRLAQIPNFLKLVSKKPVHIVIKPPQLTQPPLIGRIRGTFEVVKLILMVMRIRDLTDFSGFSGCVYVSKQGVHTKLIA